MREACNLYQQNGNSVCFPVAAPILHNQASTWLASWHWACTAAFMLSSLTSLPFCYHQAQTCGNTGATCEMLPQTSRFPSQRAFFFFFFQTLALASLLNSRYAKFLFTELKKKKKKIVCCHLQLLYNILCKT